MHKGYPRIMTKAEKNTITHLFCPLKSWYLNFVLSLQTLPKVLGFEKPTASLTSLEELWIPTR